MKLQEKTDLSLGMIDDREGYPGNWTIDWVLYVNWARISVK